MKRILATLCLAALLVAGPAYALGTGGDIGDDSPASGADLAGDLGDAGNEMDLDEGAGDDNEGSGGDDGGGESGDGGDF
jgi:hypothetical protein